MKCGQVNLEMLNFLEKMNKEGQGRIQILLGHGVKADKVGEASVGQLPFAKVVESIDHGN